MTRDPVPALFGGDKFHDFPEKQLTKFHAEIDFGVF